MIDFAHYWQAVRDEHRAFIRDVGVDFEIIPRAQIVEANKHKWSVDWVRFSSVGDTLINGWIARPDGHKPTGEGFVWLPGYSYGTPPPDSSNLVPGASTIAINVHGNPADHPYINPAGKDDYITRGIESPQTYIYRQIVLHCLMAVDLASCIEEIDQKKLVIAGMSQGGGLALIVAAHHPLVKLCFADMPFLCSIRTAIHESHSLAYRALREAIAVDESYLDTVALFDPLYHAPSITVPTHMTAGGRDPSSRAETISPVYPEIAAEPKSFRLFPDAGHIFVPEMPSIYREWMDCIFESKTV